MRFLYALHAICGIIKTETKYQNIFRAFGHDCRAVVSSQAELTAGVGSEWFGLDQDSCGGKRHPSGRAHSDPVKQPSIIILIPLRGEVLHARRCSCFRRPILRICFANNCGLHIEVHPQLFF